MLALEALALWLALREGTWRSAAAAGLVMAAAFFTKQTASIMGVGLGVGLLVVNWRRGLVYGGVAAAVLAAGIGFLVKTSDGWFWTYIFKLHQSHSYRWAVVPKVVLPDTLKHLGPVFAVLIVATVALACSRKLRRADIILWVVALAGEGAAAVGFSTPWAFSNAYIPAVFFPVRLHDGETELARVIQEANDVLWHLQIRSCTICTCHDRWPSAKSGESCPLF